jgi:hypothetical protein
VKKDFTEKSLRGHLAVYSRVNMKANSGLVIVMAFTFALMQDAVLAKSWVSSNSDLAPGKYIGQVITFYKDGSIFAGSGALIGKSHVLTAGHCLINKDKKWAGLPSAQWKPVTVMFTPGQKGSSAPFGSANATSWSVSNGLLDQTAVSRDYGVIKLNRELGTSGKPYKTAGGYLPLMIWKNNWSYDITIYGYPPSATAYQQKISDRAFNESSWTWTDPDMAWKDWHKFYTYSFLPPVGGTSGGPALMNGVIIGVNGQPRGMGATRLGGMRLSDIVYYEIRKWVADHP